MEFVKSRFGSNRRSDRTFGTRSDLLWCYPCLVPGLVLLACVVWMPVASSDTGGNTKAGRDASDAVSFTLPDVWPWAYQDADGTIKGSLIEVVDRLSELTGVPTEPRIRPIKRVLLELRSGDANFSLLYQSPALDREAINVGQLIEINVVLAALADTDYPLTLEELEGKPVGYIGGTYLGEAFERNDKIRKVTVGEMSQAVEMLSLGRISALITSDHAIVRILQAMGLRPDFLRYNIHVSGQAGALYMSREAPRPGVAEKFHTAIAQMIESDEMNRIFFGVRVLPSTMTVASLCHPPHPIAIP